MVKFSVDRIIELDVIETKASSCGVRMSARRLEPQFKGA